MGDYIPKFCVHGLTHQESKVHGANMGPTWVLSAPDGSHVGPMNLAIRAAMPLTKKILVSLIYDSKRGHDTLLQLFSSKVSPFDAL